MRLTKQENLKLMRACAQVKIIELTEKIANLRIKQMSLLNNNPDIRTFITGVYINEKKAKNEPYEEEPTSQTLANTFLESLDEIAVSFAHAENSQYFDNNSLDVDNKFEKNLSTFSYRNTLDKKYSDALEEYRTFADKLYGTSKQPIDVKEVKEFLDTKNTTHTDSFTHFAKSMKLHAPMFIAHSYQKLAEMIASRNDIRSDEYSTKLNRVFTINKPIIHLDRDFNKRLNNHGVQIAAIATAAVLALGVSAMVKNFPKGDNEGEKPPIATVTPDLGSGQTIISPSIVDEEEKIFNNSISNPSNYQEIYKDYFGKISDLYYYKTGINLDLSNYGKSQIGYNSSARIIILELDGKTYTFSGQGSSAPNYKYLKEALETTGGKITESSSAIYYIANKDGEGSLAISDSKGDPLRSGNILTGSNNAYNARYVNAGKKILQEKGISNPTEAECVGAYLTSDAHAGDAELAKTTFEFRELAEFIKSACLPNSKGESDSYTCQIYGIKADKIAKKLESTYLTNEKENSQTEEQREIGD